MSNEITNVKMLRELQKLFESMVLSLLKWMCGGEWLASSPMQGKEYLRPIHINMGDYF